MSSGSARPSNDAPNAPVFTGVSDGAAGIGFFFLRLNHVTRNPAYLGKARRVAGYIASTQHPSDTSERASTKSWICGAGRLTTPESRNPISAMTAGRFSE